MSEEVKSFGSIYGEDKGTGYAGNVWDKECLAPTLQTMQGGNRQPMIVAMRGRNPDNPSDRTKGIPTEQRLEPQQEGICNTLTSVQKDNMVLIKQATEKGYAECDIGGVADLSYPTSKTRRGRVQDNGQVSPALTVSGVDGIRKIESEYRIRKLTPLECWRLMGFTDEEFHAAEQVNSNTQLYKQAGNSIVVDVLEAIFKELMEVLDMTESQTYRIEGIKTDMMIDLVKFREREPQLFEELCKDYPAEHKNYLITVV